MPRSTVGALRSVGLILVFGTASCSGAKTALPTVPAGAAASARHTADDVRSTALAVRSSSDAFVDSVGVNVHLSDPTSAYGNTGTVVSDLTALHVRHVRDALPPGLTNLCGTFQSLASSGIHLDLETDTVPSDLATQLSCAGNAIETVEAPNEYDDSGNADWAANLRAMVSAMHDTVAGRYPLIAPDLVSEGDYAQMSGIGGLVNYGNFHDYYAGRNPETGGWGGTGQFGTYGSLQYNIGIAQQSVGSLPMMSTERGYSDAADDYAIPPNVKLAYTLRLALHAWNAGVARAYFYELLDDGPQPFSHYGLADGNGTPKPAFTALAALLAHLTDAGSSFTPNAYGLNVTAPSDVETMLLGKHDGSYELIYWTTDQEWDPVGLQPSTPVAQTITLNFSTSPRSLHWTSFTNDGTPFDGGLATGSSVTVTAWGTPTIVDITP